MGVSYKVSARSTRLLKYLAEPRLFGRYPHVYHKLNFYRRYKKESRTEQYLDSIYESKYRISLSRFKLSSHNLSIETGRYNSVPKEERLCIFCNVRKIEDEFHFLLVCPHFTELRRKYFKNYFCNWPTLNKFDQLMLSSSKKTLGNLGKFIYFAFRKRNCSRII